MHKQDFTNLEAYVSFRTSMSDDNDGGNALFAALEYWNGGFVFGDKRNSIAMQKLYPKKRHGIAIE